MTSKRRVFEGHEDEVEGKEDQMSGEEIIHVPYIWRPYPDFTGVIEYPDGVQHWYLHSRHHREDGPAVIRPDGAQWWYRHGNRHRIDGPAIIWPDGGQEWWQDGTYYGQGPDKPSNFPAE